MAIVLLIALYGEKATLGFIAFILAIVLLS
jgi:hypothetical protein